MKAIHTENFYQEQFDRFSKMSRLTLEKDLEYQMNAIKDSNLPENAIKIVEKVTAKKIADNCKQELMKRMEQIKNVESGKASLGYTTATQEYSAKKYLRLVFEFDCYQLKLFKNKYDINDGV